MREDIAHFLSEIEGPRPLFIWLVGMIGAGKSWHKKLITEYYADRRSVGSYNDGDIFLDEINKDKDHKHHRLDAGLPLVTDPNLDLVIRARLIAYLLEFDGAYCVVEATIGLDVQGIRDMSFASLLTQIDSSIYERSAFIYLACPFETRFERNERRPLSTTVGDNRKVNPAVLLRCGQKDDFLVVSSKLKRPFIVINNS